MSSSSPALSHLDESGQIRMVDVGAKSDSDRVAIARGAVRMNAHAYALLTAPGQGKGEVLNTARVAAVLAAKRCAEQIGRASCRVRGCQYVEILVGAVTFKKKQKKHK